MLEELGMIIKLHRVKNKLSQSEFAKKLGVSVTTICSLERGARKPKDFVIEALTEELKINVRKYL